MNTLQFRIIHTGTAAYEEMINLRMRVLLDPIGIPRSYIHPQKETDDILIGAYQDHTLIGCCILTRNDPSTVQLRQMAVAATLQHSGVGRQLLSFAETIARENGYQTLMMHARDEVIPFYEKCGYSLAGDQFFEVGIAHHRMQKDLLAQKRNAS